MKYLLPAFFVLFLFSCEEEEEEETYTPPVAQTSTAPKASLTERACVLCQMDITVVELQNKVSALFKNPTRQTEMLKAKHEADSLDKLYSQLMAEFNNDPTKVQTECSKKYNLNFVEDTAQRSKLFAALYVWYHTTSFPTFDTMGYIPVIKNGMYEVQDKGKTNLWTKQQHNAYLKKGLDTKAKTAAIFDHETKNLAAQILGLKEEEIDRVCLYVLGYFSLAYQLHPHVATFMKSDPTYLKYMKIQKEQWE